MVTVFERAAAGHPVSLIGVITEVTSIQQVEEQLHHDAGHDSLTGLFNRRLFAAELSKRIASHVFPMALCLCDIDHFKTVNDIYSHAAGDEALSVLAQVLYKNVRREDIVARLGGDEFCVLLPRHSMLEAMPRLERIRHEFSRREFAVGDKHFSVTASFGITDFVPGMTVKQFLQSADEAPYQAKASGRSEVSWSQRPPVAGETHPVIRMGTIPLHEDDAKSNEEQKDR